MISDVHMLEASALASGSQALRLRTLVTIRWFAVAGQTGAFLIVGLVLGFPLPVMPAGMCIFASVLLNLALLLLYPAHRRIAEREAMLYLAYDIVQLAALLYLTGGLINPFTFLILIPVTISATSLPLSQTCLLAGLATFCISLLSVFHLPLPWRRWGFDLDPIYIAGIWTSEVLGMAFIVGYAWRVAAEARRLSTAYAAAQVALAREQRLSALGALAAAAAHELGTPLATIAVVARELQLELGDGEHAEDVAILQSQAKRCREILSRLSRRPEGAEDLHFTQLPFTALVEAAAAPHIGARPEILTIQADGDGPAPVVTRSPEILHGIGNLVENAMRFAVHQVTLLIDWDEDSIFVLIGDDGPGFPAEILESIGEPYVTSRAGEGLGLGVFIAKTLLEKTGAQVQFANRIGRGAEVAIRWPRAILDLDLIPEEQQDG